MDAFRGEADYLRNLQQRFCNEQLARHEKTHELSDIIFESSDSNLHPLNTVSENPSSRIGDIPGLNTLMNGSKCPYVNCNHRFPSEKAMTEHMLDFHIMSPIIPGLTPHKLSNEKEKPFEEYFMDIAPENSNDNDMKWGTFVCKADSCNKLISFDSPAQLIAHYDWKHTFIPENLYFSTFDNTTKDSK